MKDKALNLTDLAAHFNDADSARTFLEKQRWPDGVVCPHCGAIGTAYRLAPRESKKGKHVRQGVWKCGGCREQFTVTVGTIFEDSHIPLHKWLLAFHLLCASKKGMSAHQLHRMLGVTYKSAWFMAHRIRYAMSQPPLADKLKGTVEADETYIGGKRKNRGGRGRPGPESHKQPVFAVVQRGGMVRSWHVRRVTSETLTKLMCENAEASCRVMTDDYSAYDRLKANFASHERVNHSSKEYVRDGDIHTNTIEGYFGLLKRGINGVYHQVGEQHLHRYLSEFDFRYNWRKIEDGDRTLIALKGADGKRLTLREPGSKSAS